MNICIDFIVLRLSIYLIVFLPISFIIAMVLHCACSVAIRPLHVPRARNIKLIFSSLHIDHLLEMAGHQLKRKFNDALVTLLAKCDLYVVIILFSC